MEKVFETQGTCSKAIVIDYDENTGIVNDMKFVGGCHGNTQGISALVKGMKADDIIERLEGITCGMKTTSCPDQLAKALKSLK